MFKCLLAGYGEIGKAIHEVFGKHHDITVYDTNGEYPQPQGEFDILLVCIPWQDNFIDIVHGYINLHSIKATVIFSTVPIGTTRKIQNAVHAPIEGKHPKLAESMNNWVWSVGGGNTYAEYFFDKAKKGYVLCGSPETTEIAKLASTTLYGVNIEFARYVNEICKENKVDYNYINRYNIFYNELYQRLNMPGYSRYILTPPEGKKGGHCVNNNAKILESQYPSIFNQIVLSDGGI
jgi:hypothetical protein